MRSLVLSAVLNPVLNRFVRQGFKDLSKTYKSLSSKSYRLRGDTLHVGLSDIAREVYVAKADGTVVSESFVYRGGRWETF